MMKRLLPLLVLMSGCSYVPGTDANKIAKAQDIIRRDLADGDSAKFRDETVAGGYVCGEVNGKNAFNAFVGFKPYAVSEAGKPTLMPDRNGAIGVDGLIAGFPKPCLAATPSAKARYDEAMAELNQSTEMVTDNLEQAADAYEAAHLR